MLAVLLVCIVLVHYQQLSKMATAGAGFRDDLRADRHQRVVGNAVKGSKVI